MEMELLSAEYVVEFAANYQRSVLNDDLVYLHVKALSFDVNRNRFQHKKSCLERVYETSTGVMPAYKSFERKLVNAQHKMQDQGAVANLIVGFVETATLREDGVYLDLVVWKRALSDSWLEQFRKGTVFVSMECEYDKPVFIVDGKEHSLAPQHKAPRNAVRSMSDDSMVAFVGIACLFDGVQPGDAASGILYQENAEVCRETEISNLVSLHSVTNIAGDSYMDLNEELKQELADLKAKLEQAEAEKATLEQEKADADNKLAELATAAETSANSAAELKAELDAKRGELDEIAGKLSNTSDQYYSAIQELEVLREKTFKANLESCFDVTCLCEEDAAWLSNTLKGTCGYSGDATPFEEYANRCVAIAACVKRKSNKENSEENTTTETTPPKTTPDGTNVEGASIAGKGSEQKPINLSAL